MTMAWCAAWLLGALAHAGALTPAVDFQPLVAPLEVTERALAQRAADPAAFEAVVQGLADSDAPAGWLAVVEGRGWMARGDVDAANVAFARAAGTPWEHDVGSAAASTAGSDDVVAIEALYAAKLYPLAQAAADAWTAPVGATQQDRCRVQFVRGASVYRQNRLTEAAQRLEGIAKSCAGTNAGARGQYLLAASAFRRGLFSTSAQAYRLLTERFADHSMADDGLTRGGIALWEAGERADALAWWTEAIERFPDGDTVPESALRVVMARYYDGRPDDAVEIARVLATLSHQPGDWASAGRYWGARIALYPDPKRPDHAVANSEVRDAALAAWHALCAEAPESFYAALAYARLEELDPERAHALAKAPRPVVPAKEDPWLVRADWVQSDPFRAWRWLLRAGLLTEADKLRPDVAALASTPSEHALLVAIEMRLGDRVAAHERGRRWFASVPLESVGEAKARVFRTLYPDWFLSSIRASLPSDTPPELFHALVREESNFNPTIVSHAGAKGLSQLMPATARQTAQQMGLDPGGLDLNDPDANLAVGGRYLANMQRRFFSNPALALAAYNAGPGNVRKWLAKGDLPLDEFVEAIPFRETRHYVKRVTGTWQLRTWWFGDAERFVDLGAFNHNVKGAAR